MGTQFRPVEAAAGGHEHEQVVVVAPSDDDRAEKATERDPLQRCRLLGAAGPLGHDHPMGDAGRRDGTRRGRLGVHGRGRYSGGDPTGA